MKIAVLFYYFCYDIYYVISYTSRVMKSAACDALYSRRKLYCFVSFFFLLSNRLLAFIAHFTYDSPPTGLYSLSTVVVVSYTLDSEQYSFNRH